MRVGTAIAIVAFGAGLVSPTWAQGPGFTQEDRDRMTRLETTLQVFMQQVDRRFEELRDDMNKRSELVDKRFQELRGDMNKRFELVDKRFEQMMTFLWILVAIFTTLTAAVIGFAYWDRRSMIRKARDEAIAQIEKEGRLKDLIQAMRALATENPAVADVLRRFNLL